MKLFGLTKLYLPIILFIISIIFLISFKQTENELFIISLEQFGISIELPLNSFLLQNLLILSFGLISLSLYIFYDFTEFFPQKLEMEVFFDGEGIAQCLLLFTKNEMKQLRIVSENLQEKQKQYYNLVNTEAQKLLKSEFFSMYNKDIHSEGETTFVVIKIRGIQNYYIKEAKGILKHIIERPKLKSKEFYTFFEKISSSSDTLTPSFKEMMLKNKIILTPRFKQKISHKLNSKIFNHTLAGYTVIKLFPYPKYSNTLYVLEDENLGSIPIGYAIYR